MASNGLQRVVGQTAAVCAAGAVLLAAGCSDPLAVFQEREGDLIKHQPAERLNAAPRLDVEKFKKQPLPPADMTPDALANRAEHAGQPAVKGEPVEWTLEKVRSLTIANNLALKVSLIDPAIAHQSEEFERAKFDAVFRPSASTFKTDQPNTNSTSVTQVKGVNAAGAVDIPLRTGGTLTLTTTAAYSKADNPFVSFSETYNLRLAPSLSIPLMRGAGRDVNTASIKIAGYQSDIASAGTRLQITGILAEAERSYWRLVAARQELDVRKKQYELAQTQYARAKRKVDAGDAAQIEITRAQSGVASRVVDVIRTETAVLVEQRALKRLTADPATPVDGDAMIIPTTPPELSEYALPAAELLTLAQQNRMELLQGELQILSDSLNIDLASDATRPLINLLAQYDIDSARDRFSASVHQLVEHQYQSYNVGVQGSVPFTNGQAEAALRRAILERMKSIGTLDGRKQAVQQEVLDAIDRVASAWERIIAAQQSSMLAARTLEAESRQFDRDLRTSTDVLNAAANLADAQSSEVRAIGDYRISLVDLAVATGTVLGSAGVSWEIVPPPPLSGTRWNGLRPAGENPPASTLPSKEPAVEPNPH